MRFESTPRIFLATLALIGGLLVGGPVTAGELPPPPDDVSPHGWMRTYFEDCLNHPGDYSCLVDFWTPDKVEAVERSERVRRNAFPDLSYEIIDLLIDEGHAAVRCRITGHAANPAEGESGELEIHEGFFYVLEDGKIQSGKIISDRLAVAEALGYEVNQPGAAGP